MSGSNRVLGGLEASLAVSRVTTLRTLRGRALWVVVGLSTLPFLWSLIMRDRSVDDDWGAVMAFWGYLLAVLPPVLLAGAIGEEFEEKTSAYLWSRPLPRWSIIVGKIIALLPPLWVVLGISLVIPFYALFPDAGDHGSILVRSMIAVVAGTIGAGAVTAGLAALAPRYGTVLSLAYLVFIDRTLGWLDAKIALVSVTYHSLRISGVYGEGFSVAKGLSWIAGISAVWLAIALWRVRRLE